MITMRNFAIWSALVLALAVPLVAAGLSPQLQYRQPIYIMSGFAGIVGLALLFVQPLLAANVLPSLSPRISRKIHRIVGIALVLFVTAHIAGLWITSPPDVIDALLLRSPTPFSLWGVLAMWAIFATACLAAFRRKLRLTPRHWRYAHMMLGVIIASGTIAHALLIDGTMEFYSKGGLSVLVGAATAVIAKKVFWPPK